MDGDPGPLPADAPALPDDDRPEIVGAPVASPQPEGRPPSEGSGREVIGHRR